MGMKKPTNLDELLKYLAEKPHIDFCGDARTFRHSANNGLWFFSANHGEAFVPICCEASKTVLSFDEKGFYVEKFGKKFFYEYK